VAGISAYSAINRTIHLSNIIRAQYATGRIAMPVSGGMYARLKHVQGIPAQTPGGGYSISKLRMIDVLVERLVQLKGRDAVPAAGSGQTRGMPETDALIDRYAEELSLSVRAADAISPSLAAGAATPGILFDLVA
jgi:hypothetical protein